MSAFDWPWEYNFPPFFTIQPHAKTKERQLTTWCSLILKYHKHKNQAVLNINDDSEVWSNEGIKRKLPVEGKLVVLEELQKNQNATPLDKKKTQWEIYWHTLDELAHMIHNWSVENGQTNAVCTLFELTAGDNTTNEEFYGLNQDVLLKALKVLEGKGKCELIMFDDNQGVKFF